MCDWPRVLRSFFVCLVCFPAVYLQGGQPSIQQKAVRVNVVDLVWDPTRSRIFASTGSSIVRIDPGTADVDDIIASGPVVSRIAISDDGQYLYAAIGSRGVIQRYDLRSHSLDLEISLGRNSQGSYLTAGAMIVLPGQPRSILIARGWRVDIEPYPGPVSSQDVVVYDGAIQRPSTLAIDVRSLYVRRSDGSIFAWGFSLQRIGSWGQIYWLSVNPAGVTATRSVPIDFRGDGLPNWMGSFVADRSGTVFDLNTGTTLGRATTESGYALATDSSGTSLLAIQGERQTASVLQYSLGTFRLSGNVNVEGNATILLGANQAVRNLWCWGTNGFAITGFDYTVNAASVVLVQVSGFDPVGDSAPLPRTDSSGVIHLALAANGLAYDAIRKLLWASVPGEQGQLGNSVVSIDPATGVVRDVIDAGSEPGVVVLSSDGSRLFTALGGAPAISVLDLNARRREQVFSVLDDVALDGDYFAAQSLATVPNANNSVVVVRSPYGYVYGTSIVVYDRGRPRPESFSNIKVGERVGDPSKLLDRLFPGDAPDTLYAVSAASHFEPGPSGLHPLYRLRTDNNGIHVDKALNPVGLSDVYGMGGAGLAYEAGRLFTSAGEVWTADTTQLLGRFASNGLPVLFPEQGRVLYAAPSDITSFRVTLFDSTAMRPLATQTYSWLPFLETIYEADGAVRLGSNAVAVAVRGEILLIPLTSLQPWPAYPSAVQGSQPGVRHMDLPAKAISALPGASKLLIATPSTAGSIGNNVVVLNAESGQVEGAVFAGSEPSLLALTPGGTSIYAFLAGEQRVSRINLTSRTRDLVFGADPRGFDGQYPVHDMVVAADGGLAVSDFNGAVALFDNGKPRPAVDTNTQGAFAHLPGRMGLAFDSTGALLYGFNSFLSTFELKRYAVTPQGVQWLSSAGELLAGYDAEIRYAGGLIYTSRGGVIDPERSRLVGRFVYPSASLEHVLPDPPAGRVYFVAGQGITVFDMYTHEALGFLSVSLKSFGNSRILSLVKVGDRTLAFHTDDGQLYLVDISAIPLLARPIPSPQPSLPATPGVTVVDLTAQDLAYDSSRNLLYASIPNREAALGDRIAAVDPETGRVTASYPAGRDPRLLTLSDDKSQLYFTRGWLSDRNITSSEVVRNFDISMGTIGQNFVTSTSNPDSGYEIADLAVLQGAAHSVAVIQNLWQVIVLDGWPVLVNGGPASLRIYDNGTPRPDSVSAPSLDCTSVHAGAGPSRLYCSSMKSFTQLTVEGTGVKVAASIPLGPDNSFLGKILFNNGRVYMPSGLVIDAEKMQVVARVPAQGPVAVDGDRVHWLDDPVSDSTTHTVTLRSFDLTTLQPVGAKTINVTATDVTRLVPCGNGRLAFRAGHEIYIVLPSSDPFTDPAINTSGVVGAADYSAQLTPGGIGTIFGLNLTSMVAVASATPLPTSLVGASVVINSSLRTFQAPLYFAAPSQINFQVPWQLQAPSQATAYVLSGSAKSNSATFSVITAKPGLFSLDSSGKGRGAVLIADTTDLAQPPAAVSGRTSRPVQRGEFISVYCTGLGALQETPPAAGAPTPAGTLFHVSAPVSVSIGGAVVTPSFAGLAPGFVGLFQVNVQVPANATQGDAVPVSLIVGGATSNTVTIAIQ